MFQGYPHKKPQCSLSVETETPHTKEVHREDKRHWPRKSPISLERNIWLAVEPTHLKNISQNGNLPQVGMEIKRYLKPPPRYVVFVARVFFQWPCLFCGWTFADFVWDLNNLFGRLSDEYRSIPGSLWCYGGWVWGLNVCLKNGCTFWGGCHGKYGGGMLRLAATRKSS